GGEADRAVHGQGKRGLGGLVRAAPAAEDEAAEREPEPERAEREASDRDGFPPGRQPLPAAERLLLLARQRLAAALLAERAACAQTEIEVVEYLRGLLFHLLRVYSLHRLCP